MMLFLLEQYDYGIIGIYSSREKALEAFGYQDTDGEVPSENGYSVFTHRVPKKPWLKEDYCLTVVELDA